MVESRRRRHFWRDMPCAECLTYTAISTSRNIDRIGSVLRIEDEAAMPSEYLRCNRQRRHDCSSRSLRAFSTCLLYVFQCTDTPRAGTAHGMLAMRFLNKMARKMSQCRRVCSILQRNADTIEGTIDDRREAGRPTTVYHLPAPAKMMMMSQATATSRHANTAEMRA